MWSHSNIILFDCDKIWEKEKEQVIGMQLANDNDLLAEKIDSYFTENFEVSIF